jgi:hypothetical protein
MALGGILRDNPSAHVGKRQAQNGDGKPDHAKAQKGGAKRVNPCACLADQNDCQRCTEHSAQLPHGVVDRPPTPNLAGVSPATAAPDGPTENDGAKLVHGSGGIVLLRAA